MATLTYHTPQVEDELFIENKQNKAFYDHLTFAKHNAFAKLTGLEECEDVFAMFAYLKEANTVLEVGAGFGRAIRAMSMIRPDADIHALEQCKHMCAYMEDHFFSLPGVEVIEGNIMKTQLTSRYDLVTLLWSTLSTFTPEEQLKCLRKCKSLLQPGGKIVVDIYSTSRFFSLGSDDNEYKMYVTQTEGYPHYGAMPTERALLKMAKAARLSLVEMIPYEAEGVKRKLFVLAA